MRGMFWSEMLCLAAVAGVAGQAGAGMMLTAQGNSAGFQLSTLASGFPNNGSAGPIGIGVSNSGTVIVGDIANTVTYRFATDTDNQTVAANAAIVNSGGFPFAITRVGTQLYAFDSLNNRIVQLNDNGTLNRVVRTGITGLGLTTNATNSHLLFASSSGIVDIDPSNDALTTIENALTLFDGISTDGKVVYGSYNNSGIIGFDLTTHAQVFNVAVAFSDGTAIGGGSLAGNIFVNTNLGQLIEINLTTQAQTLIATGGSRGDFVFVDPNGSLLLTQTDSILRLTPPARAIAPSKS